jgi:hypothetical protein
MTLNTGIFDVSDPQNPDRVYSAALLSRMMAKHIRDGIVHGDGNEMAVTVTDPPAMTVLVGTGTAMVQGRFCENDTALTLAVPTAHATYPRIDRVVVRLNASPGRTIDIVVKPGTAAPEPAAPALTRTAEIWELSLAQVRVEAGATSILSEKITDERGNVNLCGVACPAYVPSSQLEVVGAVDMQGKALTGLPVPSAAMDAARKGYVDAEIAAKIGGFGISQIAIDANKDWNGKNITNVGAITGAVLVPLLTDVKFLHLPDESRSAANQVYQDLTEFATASTSYVLAKTFPPIPSSGFIAAEGSGITVQCDLSAWGGDNSPCEVDFRVGGVSRVTLSSDMIHFSFHTKWINVPVSPGEVVEVWFRSGNPNGDSRIMNVKVFSLRVVYQIRQPSGPW